MTAADFCTVEASTKRRQDLGSGQIGAPATNLSSLLITPLWPVSQETIRTLDLNSPRERKECFHVPDADTLPDVLEGDTLVVDGTDYPIDWVGEWADIDGGVPCLHIVVQETKL